MIDAKKILMLALAALSGSFSLKAQQQAEMADGMRADGKIYVVVAVCLTILFGLLVYVFSLDRKISRMEKEKS